MVVTCVIYFTPFFMAYLIATTKRNLNLKNRAYILTTACVATYIRLTAQITH